MGAKNIDVFLSGGGSNTDPNASLGGIISATKLFGQLPVYDATTIAGVTLLDSVKLLSVELTFVFATKLLSIKEVGEPLAAITVDVSVDGDYVLATPDGLTELSVSVVNASLPVADAAVTVTASNIMHNLFDAVSSVNSQVGDVNYRHIYLKNKTALALSLKVIINTQLNGLDYIQIGFENTSSGSVDALLTNENSAPVGVTFNSPTIANDGVLLSLSALGYVGVFIKRTVLALTDVNTPVDTALIEVIEYT